MGFGERLREARESAELTGEELARRLATTKSTISNWENGRYQPNIEYLGALCAELEVSADWLLGRVSRDLSADALREAAAYELLSAEDRRRWRAVRLNMFAVATATGR